MPDLQKLLEQLLSNRSQTREGSPLFTEEGPEHYNAALKHNLPFASNGPFMTQLDPKKEAAFQQWLKQNNIPFDPNEKLSDYDMRGFWQSLQQGQQGRAANGHFPDTFKTPADTTFSAESKYAKDAPFVWKGNDLIDLSTGKLIFRAK